MAAKKHKNSKTVLKEIDKTIVLDFLANIDKFSTYTQVKVFDIIGRRLYYKACKIISELIDKDINYVMTLMPTDMMITTDVHMMKYGNDNAEKVAIQYIRYDNSWNVVLIPSIWMDEGFDYKSDYEKYASINKENNDEYQKTYGQMYKSLYILNSLPSARNLSIINKK